MTWSRKVQGAGCIRGLKEYGKRLDWIINEPCELGRWRERVYWFVTSTSLTSVIATLSAKTGRSCMVLTRLPCTKRSQKIPVHCY